MKISKLTAMSLFPALALGLIACKTEIEPPSGKRVDPEPTLIILPDPVPEVPVDNGYNEANVDRTLTNISVSTDAFVQVIGSFDDATTSGWTASGSFANPASSGAWKGTTRIADFDPAAAYVGLGAVSTCEINDNSEGCDAPMGSLTSPLFRVDAQRPVLNFLMAGGNGTAAVGMRILDENENEIFSFTPATCSPPHVDGDDDWQAIDLTSQIDKFVRIVIFDEESGGCGFIGFDHFYMGVTAGPGQQDFRETNVDETLFNVTVGPNAFEQVIGSFDDATTNEWVATGAFSNPVTAEAWVGTATETFDPPGAKVGLRSVTTCEMNANSEGCDAPTGSLTSPPFLINEARPMLSFLMAGGNGSAPVGLRVLLASDDSELAIFTPDSCGPPHIDGDDDWQSIDLTEYVGRFVKVQVFDEEAGGCGFVSVDHVHMTGAGFEDYAETNVNQSNTGLTVYENTFTQVIGSFDDALTNGWTATGAFENPTSASAWKGTSGITDFDPPPAYLGIGAVSTCEINDNAQGCDAPVGSLLSPTFKVDAARPKLRFLMAGGNGTAPIGLKVLNAIDDSEIASFTPDTCSPPHVDGDDDWQEIDLTAQIGAFVRVLIFDEETGACGFLGFDHVHMGGIEVISSSSVRNVDVAIDSFDQVIGAFDDPQMMLDEGWVATGDFLIDLNPATGWGFLPNNQITADATAASVIGFYAVSTCEINENANGCDGPTGTLTSPMFTVNAARPILNINLSGGDAGGNNVGMKVFDSSGGEITNINPGTCGQAFLKTNVNNWQSVDLTNYIGQMVSVEIFDEETGGCGFIAFDHLHMSSESLQATE
jgi:hypothetical protein